jgi:L-2-hydroxycarboxylate dehydrogenase (NAD+)
MILAAEAERRYVQAIVRALGGSEEEAAVVADAIREADLRGYTSHGLLRVADAIHLVRQGVPRVGARPRIAAERPAAVLMHGDRALGPWAAVAATREAMARARPWPPGWRPSPTPATAAGRSASRRRATVSSGSSPLGAW